MALAVGFMARQTTLRTELESEPMRDAVAAPISPAMLGVARAIRPEPGYFASPAVARADAEREMTASRLTKMSKAMYAHAAKLRREAERERALSVSAQ